MNLITAVIVNSALEQAQTNVRAQCPVQATLRSSLFHWKHVLRAFSIRVVRDTHPKRIQVDRHVWFHPHASPQCST